MIILLVLARQQLPPSIPIAGSCSTAISAACHAPDDEPEDGANLPMKWGVVNDNWGVGHCAFTSREVTAVRHGRTYAGTGSS
ncbi:hypothetical protein K469DRAFT_706868 [Zopfia rhizophila CBS 207.26]|uniref:Uncharacterized protein n=1 Tax=Zopfia rhizophila CBS 207.26 TaxID=1314779 RepID=A0A6A6E6V9_9PEZI|nr:hypothetical protein K469DRAFT_706868 [Zopfia rhizophila CBS 207.26]